MIAPLVRGFCVWLFKRQGWRVTGTAPDPRKFVIIAAPHTSNWDFVFFLGAADGLGLNLSFMGKSSLFRWPFEGMMREMGGIPVERGSRQNYVEQMAAEFSARDEFMLTIAPEGTRGAVRTWKTGFYRIALAAKVPMCCATMDYAKKVVDLGPAVWPTGDYEKDMLAIREHYLGCTPKYPEKGNQGFFNP
jgi:1-acyl-sn-glycerol-3-phosphate acyltransferase